MKVRRGKRGEGRGMREGVGRVAGHLSIIKSKVKG